MGPANGGIPALEYAAPPVRQAAVAAKVLGWIAATPLVTCLVPVALLAWATPWVDLPLAVDIATAPAVGMGYLTQALIGGPAWGLFSWAEGRAGLRALGEGPLRPPALDLTPWGLVVEHRPCPPSPRPVRPLPTATVARYPVDPRQVAVVADQLARSGQGAVRTARLETFSGQLEWVAAPAPGPLVLMTPPTEANGVARYLAQRFADRGVHAAVLAPDAAFLEVGLEPADVEARLRGAVVAGRVAVRALSDRPEVSEVVFLGISAGGVFGPLLMAVEPRVTRAALVFPGGDLGRIVLTSAEPTVSAYREAWAARGVPPHDLARELSRQVVTDPMRVAPAIDPRQVLLFLSSDDSMVPIETGLALRDALGRPETYLLSGNHGTASLCFGFVLREAEDFLLRRPRASAEPRD